MRISPSSGPSGYLLLVLHAHLPYIRYPEHAHHLEEMWLYEAITETYIPLLDMLGDLLSDNVDFRITLSLTPTLIEMIRDALLMARYEQYLENLIDLAEKEVFRNRGRAAIRPLARMYLRRFTRIKFLFQKVYKKDLISAFGELASSGKVELITSAATHAFLPALITMPLAAEAQIRLGVDHHYKTFRKKPAGIWLPECGFVPALDDILGKIKIKYFFLESHGILTSTPASTHSIYAPVRTPAGVVAFSRDVDSSRQVWSSIGGYPGDYDYRDFYRDIGFDLDDEYLKPYLPAGVRTFTGFKYYRITGGAGRKQPYVQKLALKKARIHADHFVTEKNKQVRFLGEQLKISPVITAAYDAELFGHWWFEGPEWLRSFLKGGHHKKNSFRFTTPSEYISGHDEIQSVMPSASSWGDKGYCATWIHSSNHWIYKHLHKAAKLLASASLRNIHARGLLRRALNQALRELLLAQSSDWPFMMKADNAAAFAEHKFREHMKNFLDLHRDISSGNIDKANLLRLEQKNNIFRDADFRIYAKREAD
jgi:1,4-alpha-glucan branching enzyme